MLWKPQSWSFQGFLRSKRAQSWWHVWQNCRDKKMIDSTRQWQQMSQSRWASSCLTCFPGTLLYIRVYSQGTHSSQSVQMAQAPQFHMFWGLRHQKPNKLVWKKRMSLGPHLCLKKQDTSHWTQSTRFRVKKMITILSYTCHSLQAVWAENGAWELWTMQEREAEDNLKNGPFANYADSLGYGVQIIVVMGVFYIMGHLAAASMTQNPAMVNPNSRGRSW